MMRRLMHQKNMAVREKARNMFNDKARRGHSSRDAYAIAMPRPRLPCPSSRARNRRHALAARRAAWLLG